MRATTLAISAMMDAGIVSSTSDAGISYDAVKCQVTLQFEMFQGLNVASFVIEGNLESLNRLFYSTPMKDLVVPGPFMARHRTFTALPLLHLAVLHQQYAVAHFLLEQHVDQKQCCGEGMTALHIAVFLQLRDMVQLLLFYRANVNVCDKFGRSPLLYAIENRDLEIGECLLACGPLDDGAEALHLAIFTEQLEFVKLLLRHGIKPEEKSRSGKNAFEILKLPRQKEFEDALRNTKCESSASSEIVSPEVKSLAELIERIPSSMQNGERPKYPVTRV